MSKYFTPITELPGDSGKSESAAGMVRYKRSTSGNNKFSKSLSSDVKFVSPKKMFPESTKQSVPNSGQFLKRGTLLRKDGSDLLGQFIRLYEKFGKSLGSATGDVGPFVEELIKNRIPLNLFDDLIDSKIEKLLDDLDIAIAGDKSAPGYSAKVNDLKAEVGTARSFWANEINGVKQKVFEYMYNNPPKPTVIAPLSTPYPRNILEGWSQLTEGLSETADPRLFFANLTNKTGKLADKNKKFVENLRDFYGNDIDTPEFNDALKDYYSGGVDDFFQYKGMQPVSPSNKALYSTLATMKHNQQQIRDLEAQNAKGLSAQEKLSNGFDAAIKKPLVYGTVVGGTALAGKAIYDWLNQNDSLDQIKNPTNPIIAPTATPLTPDSEFKFDLPVDPNARAPYKGLKMGRMGKIKKDLLGSAGKAAGKFVDEIIELIKNSGIKINAVDLDLLRIDLSTRSVDELSEYFDDLQKKINLNNAYSFNSSNLSTLNVPSTKTPSKNNKLEEAKNNILRIMNIQGKPAQIVRGMELLLKDPSKYTINGVAVTDAEIIRMYNDAKKGLNIGGKFENFLHNIGSSIDRSQGWVDDLRGESYRNKSIEDWNELSNENKNRLIAAAKKIIPDNPTELTEFDFSLPDSTPNSDLQNKALVDRAFSEGAYRFGRLNPSILQVNSTPLERIASNFKDLNKNPQQKWARNTLYGSIAGPAAAAASYYGIPAAKDKWWPEPEPGIEPLTTYTSQSPTPKYIDMLRRSYNNNAVQAEDKAKIIPAVIPKINSTSEAAKIDINSILPENLSSMATINNPNQPKNYMNDIVRGAIEGMANLSNATLDPNTAFYDNPLSDKRNETWNAYHLDKDDLQWLVDSALKNEKNIKNIPTAGKYLYEQDVALKERQKRNQAIRTKQISEWADNRDIKSELDKDDWLANINLSSSPTQSLDFPRYKPNYATPDYLAYGVTGKTKKRASSVQKADSVWNRDKFYERKPLKTLDAPEYVTSTTNTRWDSMSDKEKGRMAATQALQEAKKKYKNTSDVVQHTIQRAGEIASNIGFGAIGVTGLLAESGISGFNDLKRKTKSSVNFANGVAEVINEKNGVDAKEQMRRAKSFEDTKNKVQSGIKSTANNAISFTSSMIEQSKPVIRSVINQSKPVIRNMINQSKSGLSHLAENASDVSQDVINGITNWMQSNSSKGKTTKRYVEKSMDFQKSMTTANPIEQNQPTIQKHRNKYIDGK